MLPIVTVLPPSPSTPSTIFIPSTIPSPNPDLCTCKQTRTCSCAHSSVCAYAQVPRPRSITSSHSHGTTVSAPISSSIDLTSGTGVTGPSPSGTFPAFGQVAPFQAGGVAEATSERMKGRKTGWVITFRCLCEVDCGCACGRQSSDEEEKESNEDKKEDGVEGKNGEHGQAKDDNTAREEGRREERDGDFETNQGKHEETE